jgi:hypothetical protein
MCLCVAPSVQSTASTVVANDSLWGWDWGAVESIATVVAAVIAIWTLVAVRADSRDRSRPVVVAELRHAPIATYMSLVVRNAGASVAKDIAVRLDPDLEHWTGGQKDFGRKAIVQRYEKRIPTLGPGQELSNIFRFDATNEAESELPLDLLVTVSYERSRLWRTRYRDEFPLSVRVMAHETWVESSKSTDSQIEKSRRALEAIAEALKKVTARRREGLL